MNELLDDVGVGLEFFQDRDFPHGGRGDSLILILQFDLLDGDNLAVESISGLEDDAIGALA